jgi:hypothetical protein
MNSNTKHRAIALGHLAEAASMIDITAADYATAEPFLEDLPAGPLLLECRAELEDIAVELAMGLADADGITVVEAAMVIESTRQTLARAAWERAEQLEGE